MHTRVSPGFFVRQGGGTTSGRRVETIQALRGLAALLVVLNHATNVLDARPDFLHGLWVDYQPLNNLGAVGVDIFFVISGFAMAEAVRAKPERGAARFLIERFVRIMPLFWLISAVAAAALFALDQPMSWVSAVNTVTIFPIYPQDRYAAPMLVVGWTLAFEWTFYFLIAAGLLITRRHAVTIAMLLALDLALISLQPTARPPLGKLIFNAMHAEFAIGMGVAWLFRSGWLTVRCEAGPLLLMASAGGIGWTLWHDFSYFAYLDALFAGDGDRYRVLLWGLPAAAFVTGALALGEPWLTRGGGRGRAWRWGLRIGNASFSLYLIHLPLMWVAERVLPPMALPGEALIAALALASVGLGLAVYRWVEQPLLKLSRFAVSGSPATRTAVAAA